MRVVMLGFLAVALVFFLKGARAVAEKTELARYRVIETVTHPPGIEIREYPAQLVAEVTVPGDREQAANRGFRLLADFIFGNNSVQQKVPMTAPVTETPTRQKIPMTTPVTTTPSAVSPEEWVIRFYMPSQYSRDTLPKPNNPAIRIVETNPERVAAIRFSGTSSPQNMAKHEQLLVSYLKTHHLTAAEGVTQPTYAFYNAPFTPPFLRRNEVMIPLQPTEPTQATD